jgi:DNA-binding NarL/FixJ family response regulator
MRLPTIKVYVQHVSLEAMSDAGWEMGDGGLEAENAQGSMHNDWLLGCLTRRQRSVAKLLHDGYSRRETAQQLNVSLQAVHQIVIRMRQRLRRKTKM